MTLEHTFETIILDRDRLKRRKWRFASLLEALYRRKVRDYLAAQPKPKGRKKLAQDAPESVTQPWRDTLKALFDARYIQWTEEIKALEAQLDTLAQMLAVTPVLTTEMIQIEVSRSSDFHTQGFGAAAYAKGWLQIKAASLKKRGYTTEIRIVETRPPDKWGISPVSYGLYVNGPAWIKEALRFWPLDIAEIQEATKPLNLRVFHPSFPNYWE